VAGSRKRVHRRVQATYDCNPALFVTVMPIEWRLVTSEAEAIKKLRLNVEVFHTILRTGSRAEPLVHLIRGAGTKVIPLGSS